MKKPIKTIISIMAITLAIILSPANVFAEAKAEDENKGSNSMSLEDFKNLEFKVQDYLKLPDDKQPQSYFNTDGNEENQTRFPLTKFILDAIDTLVKIAGTIAVAMLIVTGFIMIFSQGSQNAIEKAKQMFTYEIIGLIVIVLSYVMVTLVQGLLTTG